MPKLIAPLCTPRCEGVDARGYLCVRGGILVGGKFRNATWQRESRRMMSLRLGTGMLLISILQQKYPELILFIHL